MPEWRSKCIGSLKKPQRSIAGQTIQVHRKLFRARFGRLSIFVYQNHLEPAVCFVDDGYPGMAPDRPGLQSMVRRIMAGEIRAVVVKSLDRLMRDSSLFQDFADRC